MSAGVRASVALEEIAKIPAFVRRDVLVAWSYRLAFFSDWINLALQVALFYLVGVIVDERKLPSYGGEQTTYMEFVTLGITLGAFVALALARVAMGIRQEQLTGTLESLMMTPTAPGTIQVGTVAYDLIYIPVRTALFVLIIALGFGLDYKLNGILPATAVLLAFIPFVWGIGIATAAAILTLRGGGGAAAIALTVLTIGSAAYYPIEVFPGWTQQLVEWNPMTIAAEGLREALLAGTTWGEVGRRIAVLAPASIVALAGGIGLFRLALRRERQRGTLGLY